MYYKSSYVAKYISNSNIVNIDILKVFKIKQPNKNPLENSPLDIESLASPSARSIGKGSSTDAGRSWTLPTNHPNPIVLAGGIPDTGTLPVSDLRETINNVLDNEAGEALRYGGWLGFDGLRSAIALRQSKLENLSLTEDNFILHNGSSGSLDNICQAFIEPDDVVIVEGPSYSGTVRTIRGYMANVIEAPLDEEGLSVKALLKIIDDAKLGNKRVKLLYTIPDFHNPTGITMTLQRRQQLAAICNNNHILIVEDRAYTELYFKQNSPQSIYDITNGYGTIQIGSFSKTIATGIRVGWIMADPEYIEILERVRFDMGNSPLLHRALAQYLTSGKLDSHLSKMRPIYDEKCAVLCKSLMDYCHPYVTFTPPEGGFFLWVECLGASSQQLVNAASQEGLQFPTGATFFKDGYNTDQNHIRLAFSNCNIDQLSQVGLRLRDAFHRIVD